MNVPCCASPAKSLSRRKAPLWRVGLGLGVALASAVGCSARVPIGWEAHRDGGSARDAGAGGSSDTSSSDACASAPVCGVCASGFKPGEPCRNAESCQSSDRDLFCTCTSGKVTCVPVQDVKPAPCLPCMITPPARDGAAAVPDLAPDRR